MGATAEKTPYFGGGGTGHNIQKWKNVFLVFVLFVHGRKFKDVQPFHADLSRIWSTPCEIAAFAIFIGFESPANWKLPDGLYLLMPRLYSQRFSWLSRFQRGRRGGTRIKNLKSIYFGLLVSVVLSLFLGVLLHKPKFTKLAHRNRFFSILPKKSKYQ